MFCYFLLRDFADNIFAFLLIFGTTVVRASDSMTYPWSSDVLPLRTVVVKNSDGRYTSLITITTCACAATTRFLTRTFLSRWNQIRLRLHITPILQTGPTDGSAALAAY
jgi:hypothetical protein